MTRADHQQYCDYSDEFLYFQSSVNPSCLGIFHLNTFSQFKPTFDDVLQNLNQIIGTFVCCFIPCSRSSFATLPMAIVAVGSAYPS